VRRPPADRRSRPVGATRGRCPPWNGLPTDGGGRN
jgi:hypothetical protein